MADAPIAPAAPDDRALMKFLEKVLEAQNKLGKPETGLWYRGQSDQSWDLLPGLFRPGITRQQESAAYREWVRRAESIEKPEHEEWNHLFNMQHFGVPTRLLDWTESFVVALGFSLVFSNYGKKSTPRIFILNPIALNKKTTNRAKVFEIPAEEDLKYVKTYLEGKGTMSQAIAVRPSAYTLNNRRAENQAGVFTIHDDSGEALNIQQKDDVVTSFAIEKDEIEGANLFLKLSHVNPYTIYPDFGGLAGFIRAMLTGESN